MIRIVYKVVLLGLILAIGTSATAQRHRRGTNKPTVVSTRDLAKNYQIAPELLTDTSHFTVLLDSLELIRDNFSMAAYCNEMSQRAQQMKRSLKNDYKVEGGKIWIDNKTVVNDFVIYEVALDRIIAAATYHSQNYMEREQQRLVDQEKQRQREAAEMEARRKAQIQTEVEQKKIRIEQQHATITHNCESRNIKDKSRVREYKNIYYAYLTVYNRYNLTINDTTPAYQKQLDELEAMQKHLLDNTISDNNYTSRIEHFPEKLRDAAGIEYMDIVRSYNKFFVHTAVPITFTTVNEYYQYTHELDDITSVQQRYLEVVDIRKTIDQNSKEIYSRYERVYPAVVQSYKEMENSTSLSPTFNNESEAESCISALNEFRQAQELFLLYFGRFEKMNSQSETIYQSARGNLADIRSAYKKLEPPFTHTPNIRDLGSAQRYGLTLDDFDAVQRDYIQVIDLRREIEEKGNSILHADNCEKVLRNFYRTVVKHNDITPSFTTATEGEKFLEYLNRYIDFQHRCLSCIATLDTIAQSDVEIRAYSKTHANIYNVYQIVRSSYSMNKINSYEEMDVYEQRLGSIIQLQKIIVEVLRSKDVDEINILMKGLRDVEQIKTLLKVK